MEAQQYNCPTAIVLQTVHYTRLRKWMFYVTPNSIDVAFLKWTEPLRVLVLQKRGGKVENGRFHLMAPFSAIVAGARNCVIHNRNEIVFRNAFFAVCKRYSDAIVHMINIIWICN